MRFSLSVKIWQKKALDEYTSKTVCFYGFLSSPQKNSATVPGPE